MIEMPIFAKLTSRAKFTTWLMLTASNVSRKLPSLELDAAVDVADDFGRKGLILLSKSVSRNCNAESTATISNDIMPGPID